MSNLENLRKQAKQLVRWHRDRVWTVAEVLRNAHPGFASLSDQEILDAEFKLSDAQDLLARKQGFASWAELVASSEDGAPHVRSGERTSEARLVVAKPFVFVRDIDAACDFYAEVLGFDVRFRYGNPAFYAEVARDAVTLCVRHTDAPVIDAKQAREEEIVPISIEVRGLQDLYHDFQRAGAEFSQAYRVEPYGIRSFIVDDPHGNRLLFFENAAAADEA